MRLLIKEVLVGDDTIVIRHCIPIPSAPPDGRVLRRRSAPMNPESTEVTFCVRGVPWEEVARDLNRTVRGWAAYDSYGSVTKARHDVTLHLYLMPQMTWSRQVRGVGSVSMDHRA